MRHYQTPPGQTPRMRPAVNTGPRRPPSGTSSRQHFDKRKVELGNAGAPTERPARTNTPACVARCCGSTRPCCPAWISWKATLNAVTTAPAKKDGWVSSKAPTHLDPAPRQETPGSTSRRTRSGDPGEIVGRRPGRPPETRRRARIRQIKSSRRPFPAVRFFISPRDRPRGPCGAVLIRRPSSETRMAGSIASIHRLRTSCDRRRGIRQGRVGGTTAPSQGEWQDLRRGLGGSHVPGPAEPDR